MEGPPRMADAAWFAGLLGRGDTERSRRVLPASCHQGWRSELPPRRGSRIGQVGAVGAGADGAVQVRPQRRDGARGCAPWPGGRPGSRWLARVPRRNPRADRDRRARPRGPARGPGSPVRPPPGRPARSSPMACASSMSSSISASRRRYASLAARIEQHAGVQARRERQAALCAAARITGPAALGGHQVEHVELAPGVGEEAREVAHALQVPQA